MFLLSRDALVRVIRWYALSGSLGTAEGDALELLGWSLGVLLLLGDQGNGTLGSPGDSDSLSTISVSSVAYSPPLSLSVSAYLVIDESSLLWYD